MAEHPIQGLMNVTMEKIHQMVDSNTIIGEPIQTPDGVTLIPVSRLSFGFETVGVDSDDDLTKSKLGEYGEMQHGWTADDAKGFIKILSTPLKVYYGTHPDEKR